MLCILGILIKTQENNEIESIVLFKINSNLARNVR